MNIGIMPYSFFAHVGILSNIPDQIEETRKMDSSSWQEALCCLMVSIRVLSAGVLTRRARLFWVYVGAADFWP